MAMQNFDVIYIDDEPSMTDIFNQYVNYKFKHWRARAYTNSLELYEKIITNEVSAAVWIVDIMMPQKNGAEIAAVVSRECGPGTVILGYTALDYHTLGSRIEYKDGLKYFSKIISKQDNFSNLLDFVDVWVKKDTKREQTSGPLVSDPWAGDFGESVL
jgi:response regulator of citrate/malate metabolism